MRALSNIVKRLAHAGLFHIFGANIANKIVVFVTNILIVRFLTVDEYGIFSYSFSIYSVVLLFSGFGLLSGVMQYCTEKRDEKEKSNFYRYGLTRGLLVDAGLCLGMFALGIFVRFPITEAGPYVVLIAPMLILDYLFQFIVISLRTKKQNKVFARFQFLNTALYCSGGCIGALLGGVAGTILGRYVAYAIGLSCGLCILRKLDLGLCRPMRLSRRQVADMWAYSVSTGITSIMLQLTYLVDVLVVAQMFENATTVALYKTATLLPEGFLFIPSSVMVFAMPYFIERNHELHWFKEHAIKLLATLELAMVFLAGALILLAPHLIQLLWGSEYAGSTSPFRVLSFSLVLSTPRTVCANLLAALRMTKPNFIVGCLTLVANIVFVFIFAMLFGITGAAWAVAAASAIASATSIVVLSRKLSSGDMTC